MPCSIFGDQVGEIFDTTDKPIVYEPVNTLNLRLSYVVHVFAQCWHFQAPTEVLVLRCLTAVVDVVADGVVTTEAFRGAVVTLFYSSFDKQLSGSWSLPFT